MTSARYPPELVEQLLSKCRISKESGAEVLVIGGDRDEQFLEILARRPEEFRITAQVSTERNKSLPRVKFVHGLDELEDESAEVVLYVGGNVEPLDMDTLKLINTKMAIHSALGLVRSEGAYNALLDSPEGQQWTISLSEQVNKQLGDENLARRRDWLAIFDNQVKSTPLTVTLFANPIFALPLGIHAEEWTADMTKDGLSEIVRASFGDNPPLSQDEIKATIGADSQDRMTISGSTVIVWTTKVPA